MAKKFSQQELRLLMLKQKSKVESNAATERIQSPLAKYDSTGNLSCIICKTRVKSATVWKVHVNSKQHKQNVEAAKQLKDQIVSIQQSSSQPKSIERNATNVKENSALPAAASKKVEEAPKKLLTTEELLPDKFFDDPVEDAKARKVEYKDPKEEEWERFQKEIKEAATSSNAIIAGEQEESTMARQIKEIDEQILQWARVIDMEEKKQKVLQKAKRKYEGVENKPESGNDDDDDDESEDEPTEEFPDWRSKKLNLKR